MDGSLSEWEDLALAFWSKDVRDFPQPRFSKKEIVEAGNILRGKIAEDNPAAPRVFEIAYNWRDSHMYPMWQTRKELMARVKNLQLEAITAARSKRMRSIRRKLASSGITLFQIRDLGGCRVILPSMKEVMTLVEAYRSGGSVHRVQMDKSYIDEPQHTGYRSHHFVMEFQPAESDEDAFNGFRTELQIRTNLQHAWATAVEAVGLYRNENLKADEGSPEWRRLFFLMSAQFAEEEGCRLPAGSLGRSDRRHEIRALDQALGASDLLRNLAAAFQAALPRRMGGPYLLIEYDREAQAVRVRSYSGAVSGAQMNATEKGETVLVQVDKIENLKAAYPNYFGDVAVFRDRLTSIVKGYRPSQL